MVPNNKNGSRLTGSIRCETTSRVPATAISHRKVDGTGGQIHRGLLAGQRALPGHQESDVLVQPAPEAGGGGPAEDANHRLALEIGTGFPFILSAQRCA